MALGSREAGRASLLEPDAKLHDGIGLEVGFDQTFLPVVLTQIAERQFRIGSSRHYDKRNLKNRLL